MPKQFSARMNVTYSLIVEVEADDLVEALAKFQSGDWSAERHETAEPTDWGSPGPVREEV